MRRIVVTGAAGQIGTEMVSRLRDEYGTDAVLATDIRSAGSESGPFAFVDVTNGESLDAAVGRHRADTIFHLAAILSAVGERRPQLTYQVNIGGLFNVLEVARARGCAVFTPSSIAAFGPSTPPDPTPQDTIQRPNTMYGVSKVAGELLCDYYFTRFGLDTRGVRYPGLISHVAEPGGGTTDYAVEIYYEAVRHNSYECFLARGTQLDMMFMPDAIRAAIELMEAPADSLTHRNAFNVTAMQLTPESIADSIRRRLPEFELTYDVDPERQRIAESWPRRIDDSAARSEWGWKHEYDLDAMTDEMLDELAKKL
jgi:nucleoside-diphosphate-sugar epimerase